MRKLKILLGVLATLAFVFAISMVTSNVSLTQEDTTETKVEDKYPNGCVDCHVKMGEEQDYRISTLLAKHKKHPKVKSVKIVPKDCARCHKEGKKFGSLREVVHRAHYSNPDKNYFLNNLKGNCSMCHKMDTETWKPIVKKGEANW